MSDRLTLDLRDAVRRLAAAPGFTIAALLILAIGLGGSTAIFSAVDAFALRDRPFARSHELVHIYQDSDDGQPESNSYPAYIDMMRQEVRAVDRLLPVILATTMPDHIARSLAVPRAAAMVLSTFGALAILLACMGVYSVVAFSVARRRTEMGVRMALGATRSQVTRLVVREIMTLVIGGVIAGTALAALITPALRSLLIGVQPLDLTTFLSVAMLVGTVALITTWVPARRAASADPAAVLRAE